MDKNTGKIIDYSKVKNMNAYELNHFVEVRRNLTPKEKSTMQINLYSPCACGSGKKFKFCCKT